MAELCISYARENIGAVRRLYDALAGAFNVWWDQIPFAGDYRQEIERQLLQARCIVPVWSRHSRISAHVIDEVQYAQRAGLIVLPITIDHAPPPMGFGGLQTLDMSRWANEEDEDALHRLVTALRQLLGAGVERAVELRVGNGVAAPQFVFSVSSHETQVSPESAVDALAIWRPQALLVSAYDVARAVAKETFINAVGRCQELGTSVFLDSGNYESCRKRDAKWNTTDYHMALADVPHNAAFSFDVTQRYENVAAAVASTTELAATDGQHTGAPILPIIHRPDDLSGRPRKDWLVQLIRETAHALRPPLVAVPERELGDGLIERARSVFEIRRSLDTLGYYQPLHILGTGNPMTFAVLAAAGADCCDGLEWCRTVVDHQSGHLFHFQHYDLFRWQSRLSNNELVRMAADNDQLPYAGKVAFHNLEFFDGWTAQVREAVSTGTMDRLLIEKLPGGSTTLRQLGEAIPEVFA